MKERPIIFSTPMVQAILAGRKTMTRRIIKPQPDENGVRFMKNPPLDWEQFYRQEWKPYKWDTEEGETIAKHPPYGYPGDRLWVRETFGFHGRPDISGIKYIYKADKTDSIAKILPWKPSIHMPRSAARIKLEIVSIHTERLLKISDKDCIKEGIEEVQDPMEPNTRLFKFYPINDLRDETFNTNPKTSFYSLWESIHGNGSWPINPWVWVIEFKVL